MLTQEPDTTLEEILAAEFQTPQGEPGREYMEEDLATAMSARNVGHPNMVQAMPRPTRAPSQQDNLTLAGYQDCDHLGYWLLAAIFGHFMGGYLLYCGQCPRLTGKCKRKVHRQKRGRKPIVKICLFLYLLTGTNTPEALQLYKLATDGVIAPHEGQERESGCHLHQKDFLSDTFRYLAPPGNPSNHTARGTGEPIPEVEWTHLRQHLTYRGQMLLDYVVLTLQMRQWMTKDCECRLDLVDVRSTQTHEGHDLIQLPCTEHEVVQEPRVLLPVAEDSTADANACGGGAPSVLKPIHKIHFKPDVMDEDDDLSLSWSLPAPPSPLCLPLKLHPATKTVLQQSGNADGPVLHIYTDGSASTRQEEEDNAWAIAIFAAEDKDSPWHQRTLIDWYRGLCERDPLSTQWLGATDSSSRTAEAEGLIWSLLWFVQSHRTGPIHLHSDALSVRNAANGQWKKKMLSYSDSAPCTKWSILCWDFDARSWPYRKSRE